MIVILAGIILTPPTLAVMMQVVSGEYVWWMWVIWAIACVLAWFLVTIAEMNQEEEVDSNG